LSSLAQPAPVSQPADLPSTTATAPSFTVSPNSAPAGSGDLAITLYGGGIFPDSVVKWNNITLAATYVSSSQINAVIPAVLLTGVTNASISLSSKENAIQPAPQPFDTYLLVPVNDIVYNHVDGYLYASIAGSAGPNPGNTIAAVDPVTGVIQKTLFVGSEPNRLALSTDGTQLFVGLDGAGSVRQVNLTKGIAGVQFKLGGGIGIYVPPYTAVSMAAVPGAPNSVAVYASDGVVTIYDAGVPRAKTSSGLSTYFDQNVGGLAFGPSASTLYVTSNAIGGYLYRLTVGSTGITASTQIGTGTGGSTLQYDNGLLYVPIGLAFNAATGAQAGQFSVSNGLTPPSPVPAVGPIVSDSTLSRVWIANIPSFGSPTGQVLAYNRTTYTPAGALPVTGLGANNSFSIAPNPFDLVRWGTDGLAFHTPTQLYVLQGPIVKNNSATPANVDVSVKAASTVAAGTGLTYTLTIGNLGPNPAQGVHLSYILPESVLFNSEQTSQGSCAGQGAFSCDLGTINSGKSATVTVRVIPTQPGSIVLTAIAASVSYDPVPTNNQASVTTTVTGVPYHRTPSISQLSPRLVQAGSGAFTLTVDGLGFTSASTVHWNGTALPTTLLSTGQLSATVAASLTQQLGWSRITVTTPAPGGGTSAAVPFSIYRLINVPANAIAYDPYSQKLYAVLPSTSPVVMGNSLLSINPFTGAATTPVRIGSEPNLLSETSDGKYLYVGLSGATSIGRFNLLTQKLEATVPIPATGPGGNPAIAIATVPGSDSSLAVETSSQGGIGILDISGTTGKFRSSYTFYESGDDPVFASPTEFYAFDNYTSAAQFYRYTIDAAGTHLVDATTLDNLGGGPLGLDRGFVYGIQGGIANPATTPPSQVAILPIAPFSMNTSGLAGVAVVPYAAEARSFSVVSNASPYPPVYLERFNTQHFTLEDLIPLPDLGAVNIFQGSAQGTRFGQDGLAFLLPAAASATTGSSEIFLIRGPWVLPAEAGVNPAPVLTTTDHPTIPHGTPNLVVTLTGSGFLPGATVLWNNAARTTTYINSSHLSVSIPASDLVTAHTVNLTCQNPGSVSSNVIHLTIQ
jgi:uncharacterized repeat protein (TIGR01451 family)